MLIFLDLETTGLEQEDKVCSIALITEVNGEIISKYELVNEGKKIPPKASSIHHITNEMIRDKELLIDTDLFQFLNDNNHEETVIVGHNVNFDMQKLKSVGFNFRGSVIDTLRVSKHLISECESYALQFLRYELRLYKHEVDGIVSHHALGDATVLKSLYMYLLDMATKEEMCELSFKNVLLEKFTFGKYAGRYIEEISSCDRGYLEWMQSQIVDLDDDLRYSINYYLQG
ncbi:exonuclease domain-containing protein [Sulfurimonas sp.]|nr:exonuclease domain-containing protein [Sulfurimonas sp.]